MVTVVMFALHLVLLVYFTVYKKGLRFKFLSTTDRAVLLQQNRVVEDKEGNPVIREAGIVYIPPPKGSLLVIETRATVHKLHFELPTGSGLNVAFDLVMELSYTDPDKVIFSVQESGGSMPNPKAALALEAQSQVTKVLAKLENVKDLRRKLESIQTKVKAAISPKAHNWGVRVNSVYITDYQEPAAAGEAAAILLVSEAQVEAYQKLKRAQGRDWALGQWFDTLKEMPGLRVLSGDALDAILGEVVDRE